MAQHPEVPPRGKEGDTQKERHEDRMPNFSEEFTRIEAQIAQGKFTIESIDSSTPLLHMLLFHHGELLKKAIESGSIAISESFIKSALSIARQDAVYSTSMREFLFSPEIAVPAIQEKILTYFQHMKNTNYGGYLNEFTQRLNRELFTLLPPEPDDIAMLRKNYRSIFLDILNSSLGEQFFERAFPPYAGNEPSPEFNDIVRDETYTRSAITGACGEQFLARAFPNKESLAGWMKEHYTSFFELLETSMGEKILSAVTPGNEAEEHTVNELIRAQARRFPGRFMTHLGSPMGGRLWEIVNPSSEHIKQWINDAPSFFVSALKGPFGSNLMERSQLTSADIISFRNHHTDSFFQALNTPFGDIFLKEGFSEMTLEQKRQWVQQNLYQFLHFGLISAKARELFEGMQPTASDIQSWYKQNRHDVLWLMRSPVGNKVFNLMDDTVRREALLQDRDGNLALKLNADLAENPNGIFDDLYQAKHALEDEPRGQIPADEHTAGVEIEPLNSEKCEIRTHPFSAKKITELKRFYAAFTDVAQRWAEQNNEEYGYSNSHISIGVFKNDFDLIKKEYKLFHHMIPEAFLYAYSPIERIRYRAIQSVLNTSLDTDIERTINPHIVARLQYRIGCVGGSNAQETAHATQGFENILKATLAIFGSTERLNAYRTFLESKEIRDMLIELRWLIAFRYREAEDYEYEVKKEVLALKEALDSGRKREKDEHIKQEKRRLIRNIKKAETQTVYWTELILERQQTLRQALEAVSR